MSESEGFFVDSNVLLYSVDPVESGKQVRATEWLEALWMAGAGRLSWQVLHEFYWNAVKKMRLEPSKARGIVEDISHWKPVDTTIGLLQQAWLWSDQAQLSHWDALILAAAERSGARYLLSEDFQNGRRYGDVHVLNPFEHTPVEWGL
jgi:predicted nucleic acid-binding protein